MGGANSCSIWVELMSGANRYKLVLTTNSEKREAGLETTPSNSSTDNR